jgi:hypothetical protein
MHGGCECAQGYQEEHQEAARAAARNAKLNNKLQHYDAPELPAHSTEAHGMTDSTARGDTRHSHKRRRRERERDARAEDLESSDEEGPGVEDALRSAAVGGRAMRWREGAEDDETPEERRERLAREKCDQPVLCLLTIATCTAVPPARCIP